MKQKWYLETWFICLLSTLSFLVIPVIVALVLLVMHYLEKKELNERYGRIDSLDSKIVELGTMINVKSKEYDDNCTKLSKELYERKEQINKEFKSYTDEVTKQKSELMQEFNKLQEEKDSLNTSLLIEHYNISDYDGITSEECKNKLSILKSEEQELLKSDEYVMISSSGSKQEINNNIKQIIRCLNSECDNILINISTKNIDAMRNKISKCYESLNKIFMVDGVQLSRKVLEYKLDELNLVYTYELKKEQEREQQKAIKEQMVEEEKVRREIEKQKAKIEKDQTQFSNEITKLMTYLQKSQNDIEKQLYVDKIKDLEEKLKELEQEKEMVLEREANARAGFVYVISNIGSFGEDVYKIGMTRRLEPMDRIKELSSASVPFEFDVHAMIFSENAPELENALHKHFEQQSVNRVNLRKEFFKVSIDEIEDIVKANYNNTVEFTRIPVAKEYHQTLSIIESESA
ncbi:protein of unknown function [Anaerosporobacter mobilis DSM 15930]|uniref:Bacteriophage T5 Orf172 DNA-binding domain-containing protein n=1 Tax=Anaerosporobacter mobilis DSM 15930 TaxID=1120996 RepID=A0A1M7LG20_9FIRM|nr:DUF4041 domain-containing protein [Anaerosporobacter mobilis]SHM76997.1 protein of unknown function [Anaerosporobacter mobilis DSM 15930]